MAWAAADWREQQQGCTVEDIKRLVASSDKQRYALEERQDGLYIRANQGHSIPGVRLLSLRLSRELNLTFSCCVVFVRVRWCVCVCVCVCVCDGS